MYILNNISYFYYYYSLYKLKMQKIHPTACKKNYTPCKILCTSRQDFFNQWRI